MLQRKERKYGSKAHYKKKTMEVAVLVYFCGSD